MSEQNKRIARRAFEEVMSQGDLAIADELYTADYFGHSSIGDVIGPEGVKQFVSMLRGAFPGPEATVEGQVAEGDRVATRWITRGTHKGEFQGIPPTGRQVAITGITILRVANDKLLEGWSNADMLGMLQQLGAVSEPGQPG
ncbi:MAG: ester cyclase [Anaerolineales bacterium]|nr:ester cyclase [Anaerolineales bacterium]